MSKKKYTDVSEMTRELSESPEFSKELDGRILDRQVMKHLLILRTTSGVSQEEMAEKLGCSQSRVSKLENCKDADLKFGDFVRYLSAIGRQPEILLAKKGFKITDRVKHHYFMVQELLEKLGQLSKTDETIAKGAAKFFDETGYNFLNMILATAKELPAEAQQEMVIMVPDQEEERHEPSPISSGHCELLNGEVATA